MRPETALMLRAIEPYLAVCKAVRGVVAFAGSRALVALRALLAVMLGAPLPVVRVPRPGAALPPSGALSVPAKFSLLLDSGG